MNPRIGGVRRAWLGSRWLLWLRKHERLRPVTVYVAHPDGRVSVMRVTDLSYENLTLARSLAAVGEAHAVNHRGETVWSSSTDTYLLTDRDDVVRELEQAVRDA